MLYIAKRPTDSKLWNYYLLYKLSLVKQSILGVFYIEKLGYYGPVLDLDEKDLEKVSDIVLPLDEDIVLESLLVTCRRCGWCCEANSGSFLFNSELMYLRSRYPRLSERLRRYSWVRLYDGSRVKIWHLDTGPHGRCMFYDPLERRCLIHEAKPVVCILTYCARFAIDRHGNRYVRVGTADERGRVRFRRAGGGST